MRTHSNTFVALAALAATLLTQTALAQDKIAFTSNRDGNDEVYVMNADGTGVTNLTNNGASDSHASISLNGTKIAFYSDRDGNPEVYLMSADGTGQTNISNDSASDTDPSVGPLGSMVAFVSNRDGNNEIYIMNADGTGQTNISNDSASETEPTFSQDGTQIAFTSDRTGSLQVYVMNIDGTGVAAVTNSINASKSPALSPDGTLCVYSSNRTGSWQLYRVPVAGGGTTNLTTSGGGEPSYSADGSLIAFSTSRDGNGEVYVMNSDGTGKTNVSNSSDTEGAPSFGVAPDTVVLPASFSIFRGNLRSGGLSELLASDDQKLTVRAGLTLFPSESPLQIIVNGTSPVETPSEIRFTLEASVSTPGLMQTVFMFNYDTGLYEEVDFWAASPSDSIVEVVVDTNPERFVEAGTRAMRTKIAYTQVGLTLQWPWTARLDHTFWTIIN